MKILKPVSRKKSIGCASASSSASPSPSLAVIHSDRSYTINKFDSHLVGFASQRPHKWFIIPPINNVTVRLAISKFFARLRGQHKKPKGLKSNSLIKRRYLSCSCKNNLDCLVGMLATYPLFQRKNWLVQHSINFLSTLSRNPLTQSCFRSMLNLELRNLGSTKIDIHNQPVHFRGPKIFTIDHRTQDYQSIVELSGHIVFCVNALVYGFVSRDLFYRHCYLIGGRQPYRNPRKFVPRKNNQS